MTTAVRKRTFLCMKSLPLQNITWYIQYTDHDFTKQTCARFGFLAKNSADFLLELGKRTHSGKSCNGLPVRFPKTVLCAPKNLEQHACSMEKSRNATVFSGSTCGLWSAAPTSSSTSNWTWRATWWRCTSPRTTTSTRRTSSQTHGGWGLGRLWARWLGALGRGLCRVWMARSCVAASGGMRAGSFSQYFSKTVQQNAIWLRRLSRRWTTQMESVILNEIGSRGSDPKKM